MKLCGISHVYNEEFLIFDFIQHHIDIFDEFIIIDHHSTDSTIKQIRDHAPDWKIVTSELSEFDAVLTDVEVMKWEETFPADAWKQVLNTTEFIWTPHYRQKLEDLGEVNPEIQAFAMRTFCLVDKDLDLPLELPLYKNHTWGMLDRFFGTNVPRHHRFVHRAPNGQYSPGRHSVSLTNKFIEDMYLLHWTFAPWPQTLERRMQIQRRIPQSDKNEGKGIQHIQTTESMDITYRNWLRESGDLLLDHHFKAAYDYYTTLFEDSNV